MLRIHNLQGSVFNNFNRLDRLDYNISENYNSNGRLSVRLSVSVAQTQKCAPKGRAITMHMNVLVPTQDCVHAIQASGYDKL